MRGLFVSRPRGGQIYVAHRSAKSIKLFWYRLPHKPTETYERITASEVPRNVRIHAYKWLNGEWKNGLRVRHKRVLRVQSDILLQPAARAVHPKSVHGHKRANLLGMHPTRQSAAHQERT